MTWAFFRKTSIPFLNQGQGSIFTIQECAQSILRLEKRKNRRLSHKNPKIFRFSLQYTDSFPESGSRKRFQGSGMRAIDSPHEITLRNMILREKFKNFSIFASIHTSISLNQGQGSVFTLRKCAQSFFRIK